MNIKNAKLQPFTVKQFQDLHVTQRNSQYHNVDRTDNKRAHFPEHEIHQMYSGVLINTNNLNFIHESITAV